MATVTIVESQSCPLCNGEGGITLSIGGEYVEDTCPRCRGRRIIEVTTTRCLPTVKTVEDDG